jgi:hypothetical protein
MMATTITLLVGAALRSFVSGPARRAEAAKTIPADGCVAIIAAPGRGRRSLGWTARGSCVLSLKASEHFSPMRYATWLRIREPNGSSGHARLLLTIGPSYLLDGEPDFGYPQTDAATNAPLVERVRELSE